MTVKEEEMAKRENVLLEPMEDPQLQARNEVRIRLLTIINRTEYPKTKPIKRDTSDILKDI